MGVHGERSLLECLAHGKADGDDGENEADNEDGGDDGENEEDEEDDEAAGDEAKDCGMHAGKWLRQQNGHIL